MNIRLCLMTKALFKRYYRQFEMDSAIFIDMDKYQPYTYEPEKCDKLVDRCQQMGRVYLAIKYNQEPVGELIFKNIDQSQQCCTMGIHLQNDSVKNQGYGTRAEILALQ